MMLNSKTQRVCCYCFKPFSLSEVEYRCVNLPSRCEQENDKTLADTMGVTRLLRQRVFRPARGGAGKSVTCEKCGQSTTKLVCPGCHNDLPCQFAQLDSFSIALIGASDSGKTNYIGVLVHELSSRIAARFGASLMAQDEDTRTIYESKYRRPLYRDKMAVEKTDANITGYQKPLVYRLTLQQKKWLGLFQRDPHAVSLVFFDTAGEDLNNEDRMDRTTPYLLNSQGIVLLVDPLQFPDIRGRLDRKCLPDVYEDPANIVNRVVNQFRRGGHNGLIETPIAVVLPKFDALRPLLEDEPSLLQDSRHDGFFDLDDFQNFDAKLGARVGLEGGWNQTLFQYLEKSFKNMAFFGISALGQAPVGKGEALPVGTLPKGVPLPFRVADPLLWILHKNKLVAGTSKGARA